MDEIDKMREQVMEHLKPNSDFRQRIAKLPKEEQLKIAERLKVMLAENQVNVGKIEKVIQESVKKLEKRDDYLQALTDQENQKRRIKELEEQIKEAKKAKIQRLTDEYLAILNR